MSFEQFHGRRTEVLAALAALRDAGNQIGTRSLAQRVEREVIPRLEVDRFHLVVVGEFNHGKSSFVNALLGRTVLPTGVTPTTAVIHHIIHAPDPTARILYNDGRQEPVEVDALRTWAVHDNPDPTTFEVIKYIEIGYPSPLLENRVVLVDTPGVNDLSLQRADITYSYIPQSDAVLFLLDAGQLLKESERVFLLEKLIGQSRDKIIFVVNKVDIWSPDEREEALAYVRRELAKLVKNPVIFPVSAQLALAERPGSGMPELVTYLGAFLANERGRIMLDHALAEGLAVAGLLDQGLETKRMTLHMTAEELDRKIAVLKREAEGQLQSMEQRRATIREEVAAIKAWARRDLDRFVDDVNRQLPSLIKKASGEDLRQHLGAFLESTLRDWAQAETQEIAVALEQLAERIIALVREDAKEASDKLSQALAIKAPAIDVDTFAYDVGVFALLTGGVVTLLAVNIWLGGLLAVAAPILALYARDKVETETKRRALEAAPQAFRDAANQVAPKLDEMIESFAAELDAWVVKTGREMYRSLLEVLTAARADRDNAEAQRRQTIASIEEDIARLAAVRARLEALRTALWGGERPEQIPERRPLSQG
ncbi:MAG: dynamin family protein [Myxococcales bacterium]|nr:dynamin family protein [Polyangiaceae bacterium]MDW8249693.1 dynamin family protein [Myxococcales bacterium]